MSTYSAANKAKQLQHTQSSDNRDKQVHCTLVVLRDINCTRYNMTATLTLWSRLDPATLIVIQPQLQHCSSERDKACCLSCLLNCCSCNMVLPFLLLLLCFGLAFCKLLQAHTNKHTPHSLAPKGFPKALQSAKKKKSLMLVSENKST